MSNFICTITIINFGMEILSLILFGIYSIWALISNWFRLDNKESLENMEKTMKAVEFYVNVVEYSSLAMIPIQITVILIIRCWCKECTKCRDKLLDTDPTFDKQVKSMNMKKSEYVL